MTLTTDCPGMSSSTFPDIPGQRGFATTQQLLKAGASVSHLQHLVRVGRRPLRTVYSRAPGPWSDADLLLAATLWAGPRSIVTGVHALHLHGFAQGHDAPPVATLLVPQTCRTRMRAAGYETLRTKRLPRAVMIQDVRAAPIERALADAMRLRQLTDHQLRGICLAALQNRRTTADRVTREIECGRPNADGGMVRAVLDYRRGAWSVPEAQLAAAVREHPTLPAMLLNPRLTTTDDKLIGKPDGFFPDAGVVVQVHSRQFHEGHDEVEGDRWASTVDHDLDYQTYGMVVVPVTPATIRDDLPRFVDRLSAVVRPRLGWQSGRVLVG